MTISPARLEGITADELPADQFETRCGVGHVRPRDIPKHVGFSAAAGAGTGATQTLEGQIRFGAVTPGEGKFVADKLHIFQRKGHEEGKLRTAI